MPKKDVGIYFRRILPCLALAAFLTMPPAVTWSKYVWQKDIQVTLVVNYTEQSITSLLPDGFPSEFWGQELQNMQATPTEEGLVLTADEGYTLPESITVKIGQEFFTVKTDGSEAAEGISFDPETGLLLIAESLILENPGGVTVQAAAVPETEGEAVDQGGGDQGTVDQGGGDQGTVDQEGGDQGGSDQGTVDQEGGDQGTVDQGSGDQGTVDRGTTFNAETSPIQGDIDASFAMETETESPFKAE